MEQLNHNKRSDNRIHAIKLIKSKRSVWNSFLDYEKRYQKEETKFNEYIKNTSFTNTIKYLHDNFKFMLFYLWCYKKMSNLLYDRKINKLLLFTKNLLFMAIFGLLFIVSSSILLINNGIKSVFKFLLDIIEFILAPITYKYYLLYDIDLKHDRHFKSLRDYYKYKFDQIIGTNKYQIYPLKLIKQKIENINNSNNLYIIKNIATVIFKIIDTIQLISLKFVLPNIINNIKNTVARINENIQIKYVRDILEEQIGNTNQNRSRTLVQIRNDIKNELRNQINNQMENKLEFEKLIQNATNYEIKNQKLQLLLSNNKILLDLLFTDISKSVAKDIDREFPSKEIKEKIISKYTAISKLDDNQLLKESKKNKESNQNRIQNGQMKSEEKIEKIKLNKKVYIKKQNVKNYSQNESAKNILYNSIKSLANKNLQTIEKEYYMLEKLEIEKLKNNSINSNNKSDDDMLRECKTEEYSKTEHRNNLRHTKTTLQQPKVTKSI